MCESENINHKIDCELNDAVINLNMLIEQAQSRYFDIKVKVRTNKRMYTEIVCEYKFPDFRV